MPKKTRGFDKKHATPLYLTFTPPKTEFPSQRTIDEEQEQAAKDKENGYRYEDWVDAEYGFPDDGYDYSQHFLAMGNGVFISPDGNVEDKLPIYDARSIMPADLQGGAKPQQQQQQQKKKPTSNSDEPDELIDVMALSRGRKTKEVPMVPRSKAATTTTTTTAAVAANNSGANGDSGLRKDFIIAVVERDDLDQPRDDEDEKRHMINDGGNNDKGEPEKLSKIINVFESQGDFESQEHVYKNLDKPLDKDIERALNEGSIDLKYKSTIKQMREKKMNEENGDDVTDDAKNDDENENEESECGEVEEMPDDFITRLMEDDGREGDDDFFDNYKEGDDIDGFYYDDEDDDDDFYNDEEEEEMRRERRGANPEDEEFENRQLDDLLDEYDDYGDLSGDDETQGSLSIQSILAHLEADDARRDTKKERARLTKNHLEAKRNQKLGLEAIVDEDFSAKPTAEQSEKTRELISLQETKKEKEFIEVDDDDEDGNGDDEKWDCESILCKNIYIYLYLFIFKKFLFLLVRKKVFVDLFLCLLIF